MEKEVTRQSLFSRRDLITLIWPLVVEQILNATIGLADTMMVSSLGEVAVSSVSLVDAVNQLVFYMITALAAGGAIVAAQYLGKGELEQSNEAARQLVVVTTLIASVLFVILLIAKRPVLRLCFGAAEADVMSGALRYFSVMLFSYPFMAIYGAGAALFRVQGNSRMAMMAAFVMNVINISGNALLIYVFRMGVAGAALASTIARVVGAVFLLVMLTSQRNPYRLENLWHKQALRLEKQMVGQILRLGIPNSLENLMFHAGRLILSALMATYGTAAIAANAVSGTVMTVTQIAGTAVGFATVTVVGQCVGARELEQAKRHMLSLTAVSWALTSVSTLILLPFLPKLIGFYNLSPESTAIAIQICTLCGIGNFICWSTSFTLPNGLRAASDVRFSLGVSALSMWTFRVMLSYVFGSMLGYGAFGIWLAMVIDWAFRSICFLARVFSGKWKDKATI